MSASGDRRARLELTASGRGKVMGTSPFDNWIVDIGLFIVIPLLIRLAPPVPDACTVSG